jgi:hypothetical protein
LILLLVVVLLSLLVIYPILAVLLNRSTIEITSNTLHVQHGPLPYPGNCSLPCADLKSVHTERTFKEGMPLLLPAASGSTFVPRVSWYELQATLKNGQKFKLVDGPDEPTIDCLVAAIKRHTSLTEASQIAYT